MTAEATRFLRFALVGVSNTALSLVAYTLLTGTGFPAAPASALAFAAGAANGYVLNRSWTFRAHGGPGALGRYVAVQALGALASAGGVAVATTALSLPRFAAECLVLPGVSLMTYALTRTFVFRATVRDSRERRSGLGVAERGRTRPALRGRSRPRAVP